MIARVYQAINAVAAALAQQGVPKTRLNARDNFLYRSIDDVLVQLAPLLAEHRLCILPRVLERSAAERQDHDGSLLVAVSLKVAFDLVSAEDGTSHTIEAYGEALDPGDKATAKAMQSAYKYAVLQAFCVPAVPGEDADAKSYRLQATDAAVTSAPPQGWQNWCDELKEAAVVCANSGALEDLKAGARPLLAALQRDEPVLYREIGEVCARRVQELAEDKMANRSADADGVAPPVPEPDEPPPDGKVAAEPSSASSAASPSSKVLSSGSASSQAAAPEVSATTTGAKPRSVRVTLNGKTPKKLNRAAAHG